MKKHIPLLLLLMIITTGTLTAQDFQLRSFNDITESLTSEERDVLNRDNVVFRMGRTRSGLYYTPAVPLADRVVERFESINPDVTVEAYFKIPYPDDMPTGAGRDLLLYNIVREVSNISGVQYYSRRKGRYRILFEDVYAIDVDKKPVSDSFVSRIPEYDSFGMHMKEANLGRDYYLAEYYYDGHDMSFSLTNTSVMDFLFKVVGKGEMQIDLLLIPLEKELILYGYCGVKLANPGFVNTIMDPYSSFFRRLYAMEIWFYNSLHGTDILPDKDLEEKSRN